MKSYLSTLFLIFWTLTSFAQNEFEKVDNWARSVEKRDFSSPELLAQHLCKDLKTEREKARVLFTWLAENMRYDLAGKGKEGPDARSQTEYNEKRAKIAYRTGKGICMDYALLYQKMAQAVGLECAFITGNSKGSLHGSGNATHAWNAVKINGKWALLDPTWGAGKTVNNKFRQVFQPGYFCTEPRLFALDHWPDDSKWQFLDQPMDKAAFKAQATFDYGDPETELLDTEPFAVPLSKGKDGFVELRIKMKNSPSVIELQMNHQTLKFERSEKDGWIILRFRPNAGRELELWTGAEDRGSIRTSLVGVFPIK